MSLIEDLLGELTGALRPFTDAATDPWVLDQLLAQLAVDVTQLDGGGFVAQLAAVGEAASDLENVIASPPETLAEVATMVEAAHALVDAARAISHGVPSGSEQLATDLIQLVVLRYVAHRWPVAYQSAIAAGVVGRGLTRLGGIVQCRMPTDAVLWRRFEQLFSDPVAALRGQFPANPLATVEDTRATMDVAVERFGGLATALGMPWRYGLATEDAEQFGVFASHLDHAVLLLAPHSWTGDDALGVVVSLSSVDQDDLGIVLAPFGTFTIERDLNAWHVSVQGSAEIQAIAFGGGKGFQVLATNGVLDANLAIKLTQPPSPDSTPHVVGAAKGTRLELQGATAHAVFALTADARSVDLGIDVPHAVFVLTADGADGFLSSVIGDGELRTTIDFGLRYTTAKGLHLNAGSGLSAQLPTTLTLGSLSLQQVALTLAPTEQAIEVTVVTTLGVALGPVSMLVHGLGVRASVTLPSIAPPNAFELGIGLHLPLGIGLAIEAEGVLTGSGFLFHDDAQQLYAGAMQLSLHESITLTAFGLIATLMPDGSRGYSLLIFITAEGFKPIPLGLGFNLLGVGGMVAVNRTFDEEVLRARLKNDTLGTLLFPRDVVTQAPAIVRSLASAFPARKGSYLLGVLVKVGWLTPMLVLFELALILEFGARKRLLVLGRISAILPSRENDLIRLNLDALGVIDLDQGTASIDAVLVDSRLVHKFALTGAMALRARWSSGPGSAFVLAVGGFNPHFAPPAGVPKLERVAIALCSGDNPRLTCEAYFAITSNSLQFGARAQLHAGAAGFSVDGDVGFDVLLQRSPLHFLAEFHASVQLKHETTNLFKVELEGSLEGPRPLRVSGKASFEIFWCDFSVRFDKTLVDGEKPPLPPAVDVLAELQRALSARESWSTQLAPGHSHGVALRQLPPGEQLVLDPLGRLVVKQQLVPLDTGRDIDTFGGAPVTGDRRFHVSASLNGVVQSASPVIEQFAPAQFFVMTDDEKLAAPSFETRNAGLIFGSEAMSFGGALAAPLVYEPIVFNPVGAPEQTSDLPPQALPGAHFTALSMSGSAARAPVRRLGRARFRNPAVSPAALLHPQRLSIVPLAGGEPVTVDPSVETWSDWRATVERLNRGGARWQLVAKHEIDP